MPGGCTPTPSGVILEDWVNPTGSNSSRVVPWHHRDFADIGIDFVDMGILV